jgi:hypothetical protein
VAEEKLHDIGTELRVSLKKSLHILSLQCGLLERTANVGTELLKLWPYTDLCLQIVKQEYGTATCWSDYRWSLDR